ncbi:hypothetical protein F8S13_20990 [Chloroflexia bacterium SDU3-3]|nr:hypothetical protein F8S13_20990 [Chloroflexia bacterium SDU3-3]
MHIQNDAPGRRYAPLDEIEVVGAEGGTLIVSDGARRVYLRAAAGASLRFTVGGAAGRHTILHVTDDNRLIDRAYFTVVAETGIRDVGGEFAELFDQAYLALMRYRVTHPIRWEGKLYRSAALDIGEFAQALLGLRYFEPAVQDAINLFRESQRANGMIWSDVHPFPGHRQQEGEFLHVFQDASGYFRRNPADPRTEALFVESIYHAWQATGDDAWLVATVDAAIRALEYSATDPTRWSERLGLLKGKYPIFGVKASAPGAEEPPAPEEERYGILFGDNTRYIASCRHAAAMLEHLGRAAEAARLRERAEAMEQRLEQACWEGDYYFYYVPEQHGLIYDVGVDEDSQIASANAEALGLGIPQPHAAAILRTYQRLAQSLPQGAPGEWHTIIPPFLRGTYLAPWHGTNGAVSTTGAGALALGALTHGFEQYGVDILRRVANLASQHGNKLQPLYVGAFPTPPQETFTQLSLEGLANFELEGEDDEIVAQRTIEGVPFLPLSGGPRAALALSTCQGHAAQARLEVGQTAETVYLLHTLANLESPNVCGLLALAYADGSWAYEYMFRGSNVDGWANPFAPHEYGESRFAAAWGEAQPPDHGALAYALPNPHPEKVIDHIELRAMEGGAVWAVLGVTLSDQPSRFPEDPIDMTGTGDYTNSTLLAALANGLAGVSDGASAFAHARIAPRWLAAEVGEAEVTVAYPASGGYVSYRYEHDMANRQILLLASGSGARASFHVLLPPYAQRVSVVAGDADVPHTVTAVERSRYADFEIDLLGAVAVTVAY